MNYESQQSGVGSIRGVMLFMGCLLLVTGCCLLLYVGMLIWETINAPAEIPLVVYVMEHIKTGEEAISGSMTNSQNPGQEVKFNMNWAESMRLSVYLVVGALLFSAFARVGGILISSGTAIVKLAMPAAAKNTGNS